MELVRWPSLEAVAAVHHEGEPSAVAFSPRGDIAASTDEKGRLLVWDAINGTPLWDTIAHSEPSRSVVFSPDGSHM